MVVSTTLKDRQIEDAQRQRAVLLKAWEEKVREENRIKQQEQKKNMARKRNRNQICGEENPGKGAFHRAGPNDSMLFEKSPSYDTRWDMYILVLLMPVALSSLFLVWTIAYWIEQNIQICQNQPNIHVRCYRLSNNYSPSRAWTIGLHSTTPVSISLADIALIFLIVDRLG